MRNESHWLLPACFALTRPVLGHFNPGDSRRGLRFSRHVVFPLVQRRKEAAPAVEGNRGIAASEKRTLV
ncbi:hypothetical protein NDU88_004804 [Pleurodeles waltl]|uniref:Uncharacterized protein n=1 Tax=Pleurodeles waltl TaxID=8319 RepID=A0AAV7LKX3_PLEWA|nr:hypothetical protein NDU88_004804 [Pleurodeles waltl]